jgi:hypothetical protein
LPCVAEPKRTAKTNWARWPVSPARPTFQTATHISSHPSQQILPGYPLPPNLRRPPHASQPARPPSVPTRRRRLPPLPPRASGFLLSLPAPAAPSSPSPSPPRLLHGVAMRDGGPLLRRGTRSGGSGGPAASPARRGGHRSQTTARRKIRHPLPPAAPTRWPSGAAAPSPSFPSLQPGGGRIPREEDGSGGRLPCGRREEAESGRPSPGGRRGDVVSIHLCL